MISSTMSSFDKFFQIAAMTVAMGLGLSAPAAAQSITMSCEPAGNVASMESAISGSVCCNSDTSDDPGFTIFGNFISLCGIFVSTNQCALANGPLQACCDATSDTGDQTACLCGEVSGYDSTELGFTPAGCP